MQGEFRGDFTRDSFDRGNRFSRVLMQQGRVLLDSDWNEQTAILLDYLRTLASDVLGPRAAIGDGFLISGDASDKSPLKLDFMITSGTCYLDGFPCECPPEPWEQGPGILFSSLPHPSLAWLSAPPDASGLSAAKSYLIYLDAWERHVTWRNDERIREIALGGPDTATRARVTWRVGLMEWSPPPRTPEAQVRAAAEKFLGESRPVLSSGRMRCRGGRQKPPTTPCIIDPSARYRGAENQLYRLEIHRTGPAWDGTRDAGGTPTGNASTAATIKWSRDNSSVFLPIRFLQDSEVRVDSLGPDDRHSVHEEEWVEIVDDSLLGGPGTLWQVAKIDRDQLTVTLKSPNGATPTQYDEKDSQHPLLRRWDHGGDSRLLPDGALLFAEQDGEDDNAWISLEDGIQIQFPPAPPGPALPAAPPSPRIYRAGDYWLIPARTALGDVVWPAGTDSNGKAQSYPQTGNPVPAALEPHGVEHHVAPLALIQFDASGAKDNLIDLRWVVGPPLAK